MSNVSDFSSALPARFADLAPVLDDLASKAVEGITIPPDRHDPTFGAFGLIAGFIRAAANVEGTVLETGLRTILDHEGGFVLLPRDFRLPVIEAAQAAVRNNGKDALTALRLDPRVYAVEHYTPDLVAVRRDAGVAYLLELKRTTGSYARAVLDQLEEKMTAAALVTRDALLSGRRRLVVSRVEIAIVDCSDADRRDEVIGLAGLDGLLDCAGVAGSLTYLRSRFARHVQSALVRLSSDGNGPDDPDPEIASLHPCERPGIDDPRVGEDSLVAISFARKRRLAQAHA